MSKLGVMLVCLALGLGAGAMGCGDDDAMNLPAGGSGGTGGTGGSGGSGGSGGTSGTGGTGGTAGTSGTGGIDAGQGTTCERAWQKVAECSNVDAGVDFSDIDAGIGECAGIFLCMAECQLDATCEELMNQAQTYQDCVVGCATGGI